MVQTRRGYLKHLPKAADMFVRKAIRRGMLKPGSTWRFRYKERQCNSYSRPSRSSPWPTSLVFVGPNGDEFPLIEVCVHEYSRQDSSSSRGKQKTTMVTCPSCRYGELDVAPPPGKRTGSWVNSAFCHAFHEFVSKVSGCPRPEKFAALPAPKFPADPIPPANVQAVPSVPPTPVATITVPTPPVPPTPVATVPVPPPPPRVPKEEPPSPPRSPPSPLCIILSATPRPCVVVVPPAPWSPPGPPPPPPRIPKEEPL